jgi:hypothetical protein
MHALLPAGEWMASSRHALEKLVLCMVVGAACFVLAPPRAAAQTDPAPEQLIDRLTQINCNAPGLYEHSPYDDFWAVIPDPFPKEHLQGRKPDCVPDAMRALVRLGARALPALVRHIGDSRPTGLGIGETEDPGKFQLGGQEFSAEYDGRAHRYHDYGYPSAFFDTCDHPDCATDHGFQEPYTIRVGDVCFILIGQIVNRDLVAARYQMTGFVIVNSPVETPSLAARVRADWTDVDADGLKAALLADLHMLPGKPPPGYKPNANDPSTYAQRQSWALHALSAGALRRLRFYYPQTYAALAGDDGAKRAAFERDEAKERAGYTEPDPEKLIDDLRSTNCALPGVSDTDTPDAFLAEDSFMDDFSTVRFEKYDKGQYPLACQNTGIQNVMHFGLTALPALIRHLGDKRPTGLVIGGDVNGKPAVAGGHFLSAEYDARHQTWPPLQCAADAGCEKKAAFAKPYAVKVGDICFVLIGQIVNRKLSAVRYRATGIVIVNSPVETPELAARVRADWSGVDDGGVKTALLADLHATKLEGAPDVETEAATLGALHSGALRRLRYYFPDAYAALIGPDQEKRRAFEAAERARPE